MRPKAAEDLPLPLPVLTSRTPRSSRAPAIFSSITVFLRNMRVWWRLSRSVLSVDIFTPRRG